ncbi:unnamed protein product [Lactuca saligna]|uniref:Uncharacterized protein n=1 Tax=Lactuca saligna TaxID=75948 RepID=A0AA35YNQ6_LACSI|nr:unnamed protein product [Lactuca saligna]
MTLQGESASLSDRYGLVIGLPTATSILMKKQIQYRLSHGIEYWWTYMRTNAKGLVEIRRLTEAGRLKVSVQKTFPIMQVQEAHQAKDTRINPGAGRLKIDFWIAKEIRNVHNIVGFKNFFPLQSIIELRSKVFYNLDITLFVILRFQGDSWDPVELKIGDWLCKRWTSGIDILLGTHEIKNKNVIVFLAGNETTDIKAK